MPGKDEKCVGLGDQGTEEEDPGVEVKRLFHMAGRDTEARLCAERQTELMREERSPGRKDGMGWDVEHSAQRPESAQEE